MRLSHNDYNLKLIDECTALVQALAHQLREPFHYSNEESSLMFSLLTKPNPEYSREGVAKNPQALMLNNKWFLVFDLITQQSIFSHNMRQFWQYEEELLSPKSFYSFIHPHYLGDFIKICISLYNFLHTKELRERTRMQPLSQAFEIICPFWVDKLKQYMWVKQECRPWQVDCQFNLVSHLNVYSIVRPFDEKESFPLSAIIWDEQSDYLDWSKHFHKFHVLRQPLAFTRTQAKILFLYYKHPDFKNKDIAAQLTLSLNAVNGHNKEILRRTRNSFPALSFQNVKQDILPFIALMGFFN